MGMDGVEIVMAAEERFGIAIADNEAESIVTPGQLIDLILSKVRQADFSQCESRRAFYALRRALIKLAGVPRKAIRPEVELAELLPPKKRIKQWKELRSALGADRWPTLAPQPGLLLSIAVASFLVAMLVGQHLRSATWTVGGFLAAFALGSVVTRPVHKAFPAKCRTVGQLADELTGLAPKLFGPAGPTRTRIEIASAVRSIVVDILDCDAAYREDARFVEDLGLN